MRSENCISRGVPEPTGVIGFTMAVFKFTVVVMAPKPPAQPAAEVAEEVQVAFG